MSYIRGPQWEFAPTGSITNSGHTGGICRSVRVNGLILNCGSTVTISSGGNAGGITSSNQHGGGSIIGCWFAGKILGGNQIAPIVVYSSGRTYDTITNNYYIDTFYQSTSEVQPGTNANNESAITASTLSKLHSVLNQTLSENAQLANINATLLCSWTVTNGIPTPVSKN